jgi:hypothetical protein
MKLQSRFYLLAFVMVGTLVAITVALFGPIYTAPYGDTNVITQGKVLRVGHSSIGNDQVMILYTYDVPGIPRRSGTPGSFQREQVSMGQDLSRFKPGNAVSVEYSSLLPGASRLQGFGTGSVYVQSQLQVLKQLMMVALPLMLLVMVVAFFRFRVPVQHTM